MKYVDEFRSKKIIQKISRQIHDICPARSLNIMEVCGSHTQSFCRFGLRQLLPKNLRFISGPGCPVCVSAQEYIDKALYYAKDKNIVIATFADMIHVPGEKSCLAEEKAKGAKVKIIYSPYDSLRIAQENQDKQIIFLAVGFETTAPAVALSLIEARRLKIKNLFFFASLKTMPQAMRYLLEDKKTNISGFICPGHVSAIIGAKAYEFIAKEYSIGLSIAGFEPSDILEGIYLLLCQIVKNKPAVANQYLRVVTKQGNLEAQKIISLVFKEVEADWRGLGQIPKSGLAIRDEFGNFDAEKVLTIKLPKQPRKKETAMVCRCADILKGIALPLECRFFASVCTPDKPYGPCMVSLEGACNAYYRYERKYEK